MAESKQFVNAQFSNSRSYLYALKEFVVNWFTTNYLVPYERRRELVNDLFTIIKSRVTAETALRLIEWRAATAYSLYRDMGFHRRSVYLALSNLEGTGLIVKARPIGLPSSGRSPTVYAVFDYEQEDVVKAIERDRLARTPAYSEAIRITQLLLDDYVSPKGRIMEFQAWKVLKAESRGFQPRDLAPLVFQRLRERGVKIVGGSREAF